MLTSYLLNRSRRLRKGILTLLAALAILALPVSEFRPAMLPQQTAFTRPKKEQEPPPPPRPPAAEQDPDDWI